MHRKWRDHPLTRVLKWTGTVAGIVGAVMVALNIGISGYGFLLFLYSSITWTVAGVLIAEPSMVLLQGAFVVINILGIYRWLIA